ncbi:MAG TPA: tricarballylate utilization 4Fe-4S protein TcuB [Acetobacteraceae bacterium]|nr:tricarballylate utilization 4Fe-4S protein TcuB [Acetobacteraceae bacterium]
MRTTEVMRDARRALDICNACRYCEGFCAVFPAMELRRQFTNADLSYLANLCHNCKGCYYACQYAPPHPFGVNVPKTFAELRTESYAAYAWPQPLAALFQRNGLVVSLAAALGIALVLILANLFVPQSALYGPHTGPGAFYAVIPWGVLVAFAGAAFLFAIVALVMGGMNFWRDTESGPVGDRRTVGAALRDILSLRYLGGEGHGCNDLGERFTQTRRHLHHCMFYGFLLCFASTCTATFYADILGYDAPYAFFSLPVLLGTVGGVLLCVGTAGLIWAKVAGDPGPIAPNLMGPDFALLFLLLLAGLTGLLLLAFRATGAMGPLLAIHFGIILALFLLLPFSKFVHGIYRSLALLRWAKERDQDAAVPSRPEQRAPESENLRVTLNTGPGNRA